MCLREITEITLFAATTLERVFKYAAPQYVRVDIGHEIGCNLLNGTQKLGTGGSAKPVSTLKSIPNAHDSSQMIRNQITM